MPRAHDIKFRMNSGDHNGDEYGFTLATVDGRKAWDSTRNFFQAPDMRKERIDLILTAREDNIGLSGARELALAKKILEQIETISFETTPVTLTGVDKVERSVMVGKQGRELIPVIHEIGREPEYLVKVTCWSLHE